MDASTIQAPPRNLSALIRIAVRDARALDRREFTANAHDWLRVHPHTCRVCLTGAVMAGTLGMPRPRMGD